MGKSRTQRRKHQKEASQQEKLEALERAAANLESDDELDFAAVFAEVKREIWDHANQPDSQTGGTEFALQNASDTPKGKQVPTDLKAQEPQQKIGYAQVRREELKRRLREHAQNARMQNPISQASAPLRDCAKEVDDRLESITKLLFDLEVLKTAKHVRFYKAQLLGLFHRAGLPAVDALSALFPLYLSHGMNIVSHRRARAAAPVFHERLSSLVHAYFGNPACRSYACYRPWPIRRLGEICSAGAQSPIMSKTLQSKAEFLMRMQLGGEIGAARAQVQWELDKVDAQECNVMGRFTDVVCGAVVVDEMEELVKFSQHLRTVCSDKANGLRMVQFDNSFLNEKAEFDASQDVPKITITLQVLGSKNCSWAPYICQVHLYVKPMYQFLQILMVGSLGKRLWRDVIYDPVMARERGWLGFPLDPDDMDSSLLIPDLTVSSQSSLGEALGHCSVAQATEEREKTAIEVVCAAPLISQLVVPDVSGIEGFRDMPPMLAASEAVRTLHVLAHEQTAQARASEWEQCLVPVKEDDDVWTMGLLEPSVDNGQQFLHRTFMYGVSEGDDNPTELLEKKRMMQLLKS